MHLLFVDDDRINLMLAEAACAALPGVRVSTAASGAEALGLARNDPPQLLVIDLHLPDTDGYALLHALRVDAVLSGVPAYLCTADDSADLHQTAAAAGQFKTLIALAKQAGLAGALSAPGKLTVFAPTDKAFAKVPKATLRKLQRNKAQLRSVLLYHVVKGNVTAARVVKLRSAPTLAGKQ